MSDWHKKISSYLRKEEAFSLLLLLFLLISIPLSVYLARQRQELRTSAQVSDCHTLTYPCSEGLVNFPTDEGNHPAKQAEWWYANFNVDSFGYNLAGVLALVRANTQAGTEGMALFELTDEENGAFFYKILPGTISSASGSQNITFIPFDTSQIQQVSFIQTGLPFRYEIDITGPNLNVNLTLRSQKRPLVEGGDGYVPIFPSDPSFESGYYSLSDLHATGWMDLPTTPFLSVDGRAWIDHQWFDVPGGITSPFALQQLKGNHEWFSIQLANGVEIVVWNIFRQQGGSLVKGLDNLDIIDSSGTQTGYGSNFTLNPTTFFINSEGNKMARTWNLVVPNVANLTIDTTYTNQYVPEANTFEGSSNISGTYMGQSVQGEGYAEMTLVYPANAPCGSENPICDGIDNDCDYRVDEFCTPPTPTPTPTPTFVSLNLYPVADTYVNKSYPSRNFGTRTTLQVDGSPVKIIYMKFDLKQLAGRSISSAKLRFRISDTSSSTQNVKRVSNTSWSETSITYNSRPAVGTVVTTFNTGGATGYREVDITAAVKEKLGRLLSIAIGSGGSNGLDFYSKEASTTDYRPVLIIQ